MSSLRDTTAIAAKVTDQLWGTVNKTVLEA